METSWKSDIDVWSIDLGGTGIAHDNGNGATGDKRPYNRAEANGKRAYKHIKGAWKNREYVKQLDNYFLRCEMATHALTEQELDGYAILKKYKTSIQNCCSNCLVREYETGGVEFIAAHTCKNKLCVVCNQLTQKRIRSKFVKFFEKNTDLKEQNDFAHLTLTVPHTEEKGFRGKEVYVKELLNCFNRMRKEKFWKEKVYAGEYGVEFTKNESGLHIHLHCLVLLPKEPQNVNTLRKLILFAWNKITAQTKTTLAEARAMQRIEAVTRTTDSKGNPLPLYSAITAEEAGTLCADGATHISLESLYTKKNGKKKYINEGSSDEAFMSGIMECIKYHFEPLAVESDGTLNIPLLVQILPEIHGQRLHGKFGAFYGSSSNAHPDSYMLKMVEAKDGEAETDPLCFVYESYNEAVEESMDFATSEGAVNPDTGEVAHRDEYRYVKVNIRSLFADKANGYKISIGRNRHYISGYPTLEEALIQLIGQTVKQHIPTARAANTETAAIRKQYT